MGAVHVVIMAGGIGSRFWPVSTPECPKQFIDVLGVGRSLIQLTYDRFSGIAPAQNVWVVTNAGYVDTVRQQLPDIPAENILAEPAARNTAPCIAWACWTIAQKDSEANVVVTPSDAVVMNPQEFRRVVANALEFTAARDAIVTIGIKPNRPETGYGYIKAAELAEGEINRVDAFREKPSKEVAQEYLASGNYLWNAGIFVWNVATIMDSIRRYRPGIAADMDNIAGSGDVAGIFPKCEKISIDFAVMEPAALEGRVYTHPADFGWSDLGNWASLHQLSARDEDDNCHVGPVEFYECNNCVVHAEDASRVILQGLDGYIVSLREGRLLVCRRSEEQRIKDWSTK